MLIESELLELEKYVKEFTDYIKVKKIYSLASKTNLYKNIRGYLEIFRALIDENVSVDEIKRYLVLLNKVFTSMNNVDKLKTITVNPFLRQFITFDFHEIMKEKIWVDIVAHCNDLQFNEAERTALLTYRERLIDGIETSLTRRCYLDYRRVLVKLGLLKRKNFVNKLPRISKDGELLKSMTRSSIENIKWDIKFLFDLGYKADEIVNVMKEYFDQIPKLLDKDELFYIYELMQYVNDKEVDSFWSVIRIFYFFLEHTRFEIKKLNLDGLEKYYYDAKDADKIQMTIDLFGSALEHKTLLENEKYLNKRTRFLWEKYKDNEKILSETDRNKLYSNNTKELLHVFKIFSKVRKKPITNYKEFVKELKFLYSNEGLIWMGHPNADRLLYMLMNMLFLMSSMLLKSVHLDFPKLKNATAFIDFYRIKMEELYFRNEYKPEEIEHVFHITDRANKISFEVIENSVEQLRDSDYYAFYIDFTDYFFKRETLTSKMRIESVETVLAKIDGVDALRVINKYPFIKKALNFDITKIIKEVQGYKFSHWSDIAQYQISDTEKAQLQMRKLELNELYKEFSSKQNKPGQYAIGSLLAKLGSYTDKREPLDIFVDYEKAPQSDLRNKQEDHVILLHYFLAIGYSVPDVIDLYPFFRTSFKNLPFSVAFNDLIIDKAEDAETWVKWAAQKQCWEMLTAYSDKEPETFSTLVDMFYKVPYHEKYFENYWAVFSNFNLETGVKNNVGSLYNGEIFRMNVQFEYDFELFGVSQKKLSDLSMDNFFKGLKVAFNHFEFKIRTQDEGYEKALFKFKEARLGWKNRFVEQAIYEFNRINFNKLKYMVALFEIVKNNCKMMDKTIEKFKAQLPGVELKVPDHDRLYFWLMVVLRDVLSKNVK